MKAKRMDTRRMWAVVERSSGRLAIIRFTREACACGDDRYRIARVEVREVVKGEVKAITPKQIKTLKVCADAFDAMDRGLQRITSGNVAHSSAGMRACALSASRQLRGVISELARTKKARVK